MADFGRRTILKGMGVLAGKMLSPAKAVSAALASAGEEISQNIPQNVQEKIPVTLEIVKGFISTHIYGFKKIQVDDETTDRPRVEYKGHYFDLEEMQAGIFKHYSKNPDQLCDILGGEGLYDMNRKLGNVFGKMFTAVVDRVGAQNLAKLIVPDNGFSYLEDQNLYYLQDINSLCPKFNKFFNNRDIEKLRSLDDRSPDSALQIQKEMYNYFKKRGYTEQPELVKKANKTKPHQNQNDDDISDDDWLATTHGGYEPGQSHLWNKNRMFEGCKCFTTSYKALLESCI